MKRSIFLLFASAVALSVSACQQSANETEQVQGSALGIVPASMDRSVQPGKPKTWRALSPISIFLCSGERRMRSYAATSSLDCWYG